MGGKGNYQATYESRPSGNIVSAIDIMDGEKRDTSNCVLLLDDNPYFRPIIVELLCAHGYEVWQARNPKEADAYLAVADPALVIVDCHLPGLDSLSWIAEVRECGKNWPIVFISGSWFDEKTFSWLRNILKVSRMIQKPFDLDHLINIVDETLPGAHLSHHGRAHAQGVVHDLAEHAQYEPSQTAAEPNDFKESADLSPQ